MKEFHGCRSWMLCAFVAAAGNFTAITAHGSERADAETRLLQNYAGLRVHRQNDFERAYYGRGMNVGGTAEASTREWLTRHAQALGPKDLDLRVLSRHKIGLGSLQVHAYRQHIDGLPVEYSVGRLITREKLGSQVIYAAAHVVSRPLRGFDPIRIASNAAQLVARSHSVYSHLSKWSKPELVVYPGEVGNPADIVRAWKFTGETPMIANYDGYTFFVDASTGKLLHARREVYFADIAGRVKGFGSPGALPDAPANPAVQHDLPELELRNGSDSLLTGLDGAFLIPHEGDDSVQLSGALLGPWVRVETIQGEPLEIKQLVGPLLQNELLFNPVPNEFDTAQVNAFLHVNLAHEFYKSRQPAFTGLDIQIPTRVNMDSTCNAFFSPIDISMNFHNAGGCVNTAYSSVIHHEYGHFIVNRHNLRQEAFGEGYGDTVSILINNDPVVGRDFLGAGNPVRDTVQADRQYPCQGASHECGQVLAGFWWNIKEELAASLGEDEGLQIARQLFTDWTEMTLGIPFGPNSANPRMAVEVLTVDDDDADISNGTPHGAEICAGFAAHSIMCPGVCEDAGRLRVSCRAGSGVLRATLSSDFAEGDEVAFTLMTNGEVQTSTVNRRGVARTTFDVPDGFHKVCVNSCPGLCKTIGCAP